MILCLPLNFLKGDSLKDAVRKNNKRKNISRPPTLC